jgi:mercuric ion binding protein
LLLPVADRIRSAIPRQACSRLLAATLLTIFATVTAADENTYHIHVAGLACPFCVYGLERSLGRIEGVESVTVSLKTGLIRIVVRENTMLDEAQVRETVRDAGFTVEAIEAAEPIVSNKAVDGAGR